VILRLAILIQYRSVTDTHTDTRRRHIPRLAWLSLGKNLQDVLPEYTDTNSESLAQICTPMAEIQNFFRGLFFIGIPVYVNSHLCNKYSENRTNGAYDLVYRSYSVDLRR